MALSQERSKPYPLIGFSPEVRLLVYNAQEQAINSKSPEVLPRHFLSVIKQVERTLGQLDEETVRFHFGRARLDGAGLKAGSVIAYSSDMKDMIQAAAGIARMRIQETGGLNRILVSEFMQAVREYLEKLLVRLLKKKND